MPGGDAEFDGGSIAGWVVKAARQAAFRSQEVTAVTDTVWTHVPRITPSSVGDLECARKYHTLRVEKKWPSRPPLENVAFGTAVHDVLRQLYMTRNGGILDLTNVEAMARSSVYRARYPRDVDRQRALAKVMEAVCMYVTNDDEEDIAATLDLERMTEFPFRHCGQDIYMVSAKIDRTLVRPSAPSRLVARDYKLTAQRIDLREAFILLWSAKQMRPGYESYAIEYDWIDAEERQVRRDVVEGYELKGQHTIIRDAALRILSADDHPPSPGDACTFCPLRQNCQGLDAVELAEGEDIF